MEKHKEEERMCEKMKKNYVRKYQAVVLITTLMLLLGSFLFGKSVSTYAASDVPGKVTLQSVTTPSYGQAKITWKKANNATNYYIYYKEAEAGKWTRLATVKSGSTSYTHKASAKYPLTNGKSYFYTVRAYNSASKKTGTYNKKGIMVQILPETVKLKTAQINSDQISVNLTWNKASGCDSYEIYRRTYRSAWKMIARVKADVLKYTDVTPLRGWNNYYTVCAYDSKTKIGSNRSNIVVASLDSPSFTFSTVRAAYMDVLRGVQAGDMRDLFDAMWSGGVNVEYFVYDMNNDSIPELIVGSDCTWEEENKSYTRKICQVYTCEKTALGYQPRRLSGTLWDPQMSGKNKYLYENYYWYSRSVNIKHIWFLNGESFGKYGETLQYTIGSKELIDFDTENPKPAWKKITDTSALAGV